MTEIKLSSKAKGLKKGKYRHYKNKFYRVLGVAIYSETLEELVIYQALYGEELIWVRPLDMFFETVVVEGKKVRRFTFINE